MRKRTTLIAVIAVVAATFATSGPLGAQTGDEIDTRPGPERVGGSVSSDFELRSPDDLVQVFIQLDEPSVAEFAADGANRAAQQAQGQAVLAQQDSVRSDLGSMIADELSNLVVGANGFRAMVRARDIPSIRATDGVKSVASVTRYHLDNETSVPWIGGTAVQTAGFTGAGTSIAVIDTGIDYTHAAFGGAGTEAAYDSNDPGLVEPGTFPTAKVVNGYDFAGPIYDASSDDPAKTTPSPDADPLDVHGHGTHVAGTTAGVGSTTVGVGMAPDAELLALKVFGDVAGSTDLVSDAIEFALDPNNDLSTDDAVDVINMSLGSPFGHPDDPSAIASQNAVDLGVVVVASAGNEGTPPYVTGSPAVADDVISVAASIDDGVEVLAMTVNSPESIAGSYEAGGSDFGDLTPSTTGDLAISAPLDACTAITSNMTGAIALIERGTCSFTTKVRNAEDAGAIGALVFNNVDGAPFNMAHDGTPPIPTIPAMMIGNTDGEAILAEAGTATVNVTLREDITIPKPEITDNMADFTSRGPGFGNTFKPDVSAPGFSIGSAAVGSGDGLALSSGTSMAAPHIAGAAAQMLDAHPTLTPAQVKALLMGSATPAQIDGPSFDPGSVPVALQGTGIVDVAKAALDLEGYATPGGVVFRLNPTAEVTETATIDIARLDGDPDATYDVAIVTNQTLPGVTWEASAAAVTTTGGAGSVDVSVTADPAAMDPDDGIYSQSESDGWLVLTNQSNAADEIRVGLVAVADPASQVSASGGENVIDLSNSGPADGFADGFTHLGGGDGSLGAVGYRTGEVTDSSGTYRTIDFGVALDEAWSSASANEIDIFVDVDQNGTDDYVIVAADLGFLTGSPPTGQVVTALIALDGSFSSLLYFAVADFNDKVIVLPADITGDFGFAPDDVSAFDITTVVFDSLGLAGMSETVTVDLAGELTSTDTLSAAVPAGVSAPVAIEGEGEMLWMFSNNMVSSQYTVTEVTTEPALPPPPPPPPPPDGPPEPPPPVSEPPSFDDVADDHLFHREVTWLAQHGITRGCNPPANNLFCPDDPVTRAQMAAFLTRGLQLAATDEDFFVDDDGLVLEGDINRMAAAGITRGCNPPANDMYCPGDPVTRAQMATFMVRGWNLTDGAGSDLFVDDDGNIHETAIDILGTSEVTRGCNPPTNDMYCPDDDITRGQMAAFIFRAFQAVGTGP